MILESALYRLRSYAGTIDTRDGGYIYAEVKENGQVVILAGGDIKSRKLLCRHLHEYTDISDTHTTNVKGI